MEHDTSRLPISGSFLYSFCSHLIGTIASAMPTTTTTTTTFACAPRHFSALCESITLHEVGKPSWIGDLQCVLARLAPSIVLNHHDLFVPMMSSLIASVEAIAISQ